MIENLKKWFYIETEGIGWKILKIIGVISIGVYLWYVFDREVYLDIEIKTMNEKDFIKFRQENKVDILYDHTKTHDSDALNMKYILISKDSSEIDNIEIYEFDETNNLYDSTKNYDKWYDSVFKKVDIKEADYLLPVPPTSYIALYLPVTEGLPMYRYKIFFDDYSIIKDVNANGRYGSVGDNHSKVKGKQTFISYIKNKFTNKFK